MKTLNPHKEKYTILKTSEDTSEQIDVIFRGGKTISKEMEDSLWVELFETLGLFNSE